MEPWCVSWGLDGSVGEKACKDSESDSLAGSKGGRRGGRLSTEARDARSLSPLDRECRRGLPSVEIETRGTLWLSRTSISSGMVSAGGEAVKVFVLDMGRRDGGDFSRLARCCFSTLCRFSTGGNSKLIRSLGVIELRFPFGPMLIRSILCRTVFSNSLFLADGKYSAK